MTSLLSIFIFWITCIRKYVILFIFLYKILYVLRRRYLMLCILLNMIRWIGWILWSLLGFLSIMRLLFSRGYSFYYLDTSENRKGVGYPGSIQDKHKFVTKLKATLTIRQLEEHHSIKNRLNSKIQKYPRLTFIIFSISYTKLFIS